MNEFARLHFQILFNIKKKNVIAYIYQAVIGKSVLNLILSISLTNFLKITL